VAWIMRDIRFHRMQSRDDLFPPEPTMEACLTDLAVPGNGAAATQHHAMKALVFLYTRVLNQALLGSIKAVRADQQINVPVVMTREAVARVMALLDGTAPLVAKMLYGSGLRLMEAVDRAFGAGREGPMHHRSGPPDAVAPEPPGRGQAAASAGPQAEAWGGLPAPCVGSDGSPCPEGVGLAVGRPRPGPRGSPSCWCQTPAPC
jgi:hypothetical protein